MYIFRHVIFNEAELTESKNVRNSSQSATAPIIIANDVNTTSTTIDVTDEEYILRRIWRKVLLRDAPVRLYIRLNYSNRYFRKQ
jgi:hypothetical protein